MAVKLWVEFLMGFRQSWAVPDSVQAVLQGWYGVKGCYMSPRAIILWKCIPYVACCCIWAKRNGHIIEEKEVSIKVMKERALGLLYRCTTHLPEFLGSTFSMWAFEWENLVFR